MHDAILPAHLITALMGKAREHFCLGTEARSLQSDRRDLGGRKREDVLVQPK